RGGFGGRLGQRRNRPGQAAAPVGVFVDGAGKVRLLLGPQQILGLDGDQGRGRGGQVAVQVGGRRPGDGVEPRHLGGALGAGGGGVGQFAQARAPVQVAPPAPARPGGQVVAAPTGQR